MGLFNSSKNPDDKKKQAKEQKPKLRTFILEPILTPSGLVDGGDDVPDLIDLPDQDDFDFVEELAEIASVADEELGDDGSEILDFFDPEELDDGSDFVQIESNFTSGYFIVGDSGQVEIDFLFDGGGYKGELAIFSLEGMEELEAGSSEFIAQAASRALSDSELGHIVISDRGEGARFSGELGEPNYNRGEYLGAKTFNMKPGDEFGFMLVPNGRVEEVVANPDLAGAKTPLFSLATANPEDAFHFGQIADVTGDGHTFALEDLRVDGPSDGDYNDIIFQVKGATGEATLLDEVIDPDLDWREGELGTEILNYAESQIETDFDEVLASFNLDQEYQDSLTQAFDYVSQQLEDFVAEPDFVQRLNLAFGDSWDEETASNLISNIVSKQELPSFEVVSFNDLNANGAFGEGTIYLSEEFLQQNLDNPEAVGKVILEELGHYLDSQLNSVDSPGDEGAIFAAVVTQDSYDAGDITALQQENDIGLLTLSGGEVIQVELLNVSVPDININNVSILEGDSGTTNAGFTVSLSELSSETVTVKYSISGIGATHGEDYQVVSGTLTFAPGDTSENIFVPIIGDTFGETDETFYLSLYGATNANIATSFAQGTILNDDGLPPVLSIADTSVTEGDSGTTDAVFDVSLSEAGAQPITVSFFTYDNDATEGEDYQSVSGTLTFAPGDTTKSIVVPVIGDTLSEFDEIFRLNYSVKNASASSFYAQGTILNDDGSPPALSIADVSVTEGDANNTDAVFDVTLSEAGTQPITVNFNTSNGYSNGAIAGEDYQAVSGTLTFAPGETTRSITVPVIGDTLWEYDETFGISLYGATNASISQPFAQGTILNDEAPPPTLSITDAFTAEGDIGTTDAVFDVSLSEASTQPITVNFNTLDGFTNKAVAGEDYQAVNGTLTFAPGETTQSISVPIIGDTSGELDETFNVSLYGATNANITQSFAQGTIFNDDGSPPTLSIADVLTVEGDTGTTDALFDVSLSEASTQAVTVNFNTFSYYNQATRGEDYQFVSGTLTFAPGETTQTINIPIIGDTLGEPDEIFGVNLYNASNASVADSAAQGTILNNDGAILALSIDNVSVTEGDTGTTDALFTVSLSEAGSQPITVDFNTSSHYNGATAGEDYQTVSGTLTFAPGETTQTLVVPVVGDELDETDESFSVNLSNAGGAIITDSSGWGSIITDDGPIIDIDHSALLEGDTGTSNAEFVVSLSEASDETITVDFITNDASATAGEDYQAVSGTLTFAPGETSQTLVVPVIGDTLDETDEQFYVDFSNATNAALSPYSTQGWGTIYNDDQGPLLLSISDVSLSEGNSFYTGFEYNFDIPSDSSALRFFISDLDFDTSDSGFVKDAFEVALVDSNGDSLVPSIGSWGRALAYTPTDNDAFFNFSEAEYPHSPPGVTLKGDRNIVEVNLAGITAGTDAKLVFRLLNNDNDTTTSVNLTNIEIFEGNDTPVIDDRSLPPLSNNPVDIFQLSDISQEALVEYHQTSFNDKTEVLSTEVSVLEAPYQKFDGPVLVAVKGISDPSVEVVNADGVTPDGLPYYDFTNLWTGEAADPHDVRPLSFHNPNGVQFDYELVILGQAVTTPINPDITVGDISLTEGDTGTTQAEFVVSLSEPSDRYITLDFTTTDGTAVVGEDYEATNGTITFAPGETSKTITVPVIGDSVDEIDETFNVTLSNPTNGTITDSEGVATIVDNDDSQPLQLNVSDATVVEGDTGTTDAQFTVTLSATSTETVTVEYFTQDRDAVAGED
ncbi:MAG: Calx-beta domain-containing protein, partial [Spirulinaceae cyanobacterium]